MSLQNQVAKGKTKLQFSSFYGTDQINNQLEFANTDQYFEMARKIEETATDPAPGYINESTNVNTNWMDELFSNGSIQNYNLTLTGGNKDLNYMLSGSFNRREGILLGESRDKQQVRAKINGTKGRLELGANIYYVQTDDELFGSQINRAYQLMPNIPVKDPSKESGFGYISDGTGVPDHTNAIGEDFFNDNTEKEKNLVTNFTAALSIIDGLKLTGRAGIENSYESLYGRVRPHTVSNKREVEFHAVGNGSSEYLQTNFEAFLNYEKSFGDHSIGLLAGASSQDISENGFAGFCRGKEHYSCG